MLQAFGYHKVNAIVINTPLDRCLKQNAQRQRKVPEHVIRAMHSKIVSNTKVFINEGFAKVTTVSVTDQ
jgi:predicted kinase